MPLSLPKVRPLGPQGKLQLAKDLAELQLAVGQSLFPLEQLVQPYRVVKAFRALLFSDVAGITTSPLIGDLPPTITLHHLFSRQVALRGASSRSQAPPVILRIEFSDASATPD